MAHWFDRIVPSNSTTRKSNCMTWFSPWPKWDRMPCFEWFYENRRENQSTIDLFRSEGYFFFSFRPHERTIDDLEIIYDELLHVKALSHLSSLVKRELAGVLIFEAHPFKGEVCKFWLAKKTVMCPSFPQCSRRVTKANLGTSSWKVQCNVRCTGRELWEHFRKEMILVN